MAERERVMPRLARPVASVALPCRGTFLADVLTACSEQYSSVRCEFDSGTQIVIYGTEDVDDTDPRLLHTDVAVTP